MELYKKYRPDDLRDLIGQDSVVKTLSSFIENDSLPHAMLFSGDSGVGKTTTARILKGILGCSEFDFHEINAAEARGIDTIREMKEKVAFAPLGGCSQIYLIDEAHKITPDAQTAMLKMLEDTPKTVYYILCTTEPQKLIKTIRTRCTELKFSPISTESLVFFLSGILKTENKELSHTVVKQIAECAGGSARKALVLLEQVLANPAGVDQILLTADEGTTGFQIAQALFSKSSWPQCASLLKDLEDDPESVRLLILKYASTIILNSSGRKAAYAAEVIAAFENSFYEGKKASLLLRCFSCLSSGLRKDL